MDRNDGPGPFGRGTGTTARCRYRRSRRAPPHSQSEAPRGGAAPAPKKERQPVGPVVALLFRDNSEAPPRRMFPRGKGQYGQPGRFGKTSADEPPLPHGLGEKSSAGSDSGGDSVVNPEADLGSARQVNSASSPEVGAGPMRMTRQGSSPQTIQRPTRGQFKVRPGGLPGRPTLSPAGQFCSRPGINPRLLARGLFSVRPGNWPGWSARGPAGALRFSSRRPNRPHRRCPARCRRAR